MSGYIIPLVAKRKVDYASLPNPGQQDVILADRVEVIHWRELTVRVQVFDHSLISNAGTITVMVIPMSWTEEEPNQPFLSSISAGDVIIQNNTLTPAFLTKNLTTNGADCMTAMARVVARGIRSAGGAMNATISVDFSAKDA